MKTNLKEVRAGIISSLLLAIWYLLIFKGLSSSLGILAFSVLVAVCSVLMVKSIIELLMWVYFQIAIFLGKGLGETVKLVRHGKLAA